MNIKEKLHSGTVIVIENVRFHHVNKIKEFLTSNLTL